MFARVTRVNSEVNSQVNSQVKSSVEHQIAVNCYAMLCNQCIQCIQCTQCRLLKSNNVLNVLNVMLWFVHTYRLCVVCTVVQCHPLDRQTTQPHTTTISLIGRVYHRILIGLIVSCSHCGQRVCEKRFDYSDSGIVIV